MNNKFTILLLALCLLALNLPSHAQTNHAQTSVGELELSDDNNQRQLALLLNTDIGGSINGLLASINVRQTFRNQTDEWVNGRYVFPLPEEAAVDSLQIQIGERIIDGIIKEKEEAKQTFAKAKKAGKKAGLLEQHRPNLFSISLANIAPHEEVIANITYIDKVHYEDDVFSLRLPSTLTPRYIPGAPIHLSKEDQQEITSQLSQLQKQSNTTIDPASGWAVNTIDVPDAADITPPQTTIAPTQTSHLFELDLSLNAGIALHDVNSTSHQIKTGFTDNGTVTIQLANGTEAMNNDLLLAWQAKSGAIPQAAFFQQESSSDHYSMLMVTPPQIKSAISLPRDITFIVDSSGSMAGGSMQQAKQSLHRGLSYLSNNDRFNIIDFDSQFRPLFQQSQAANRNNLQMAHSMINNLSADGGTEMYGALDYALNNNRNSNDTHLKQIVFITDGAIGNETQLFSLINQNLGDTRLFTVGIGSAPNTYFMNRAAQFGRGSFTYISDLSQVDESMALLFKKITHPVLRDIKIDWGPDLKVEHYPQRLPDLYAGEPLMVLIKSEQRLSAIQLSGTMLQSPWEQSLNLGSTSQEAKQAPNTDNIDAVWARQKVTDLMDKLVTNELNLEQVKPMVIDLGIKHNIVTKFTSFIAVETTPSRPKQEKAKHKNVPNLMPKGSTMAAPQTATPATLLSLLGSLMMALGWVFKRRNRLSARGTTTSA